VVATPTSKANNLSKVKAAAVDSSEVSATSSTVLLAVAVRARRTKTTLTKVGYLHSFGRRFAHILTGVDFVQEKFMGQGSQDNESAVEQAKDEQISDFIRGSKL